MNLVGKESSKCLPRVSLKSGWLMPARAKLTQSSSMLPVGGCARAPNAAIAANEAYKRKADRELRLRILPPSKPGRLSSSR